MSFPKTKEELKRRLLEEANHPPQTITVDEYRHIYELSKFGCPFKLRYQDCNMNDCRAKPNEIWESYAEECHQMRQAKNLIERIFSGEVVVDYNSSGWEVPV